MENAADALKIAFAIFVLVTAITITFTLVSQAKSTADVVLYYSDKTNFYDYRGSTTLNRDVPVTEVIATLYRYYKESISVTVILDTGTKTFNLTNLALDITTIEDELADYTEKLLEDYSDKTFTEEFVEVPISGKYEVGEDGTEITMTAGGKKVYVTYTLQP